MVPILAVLLLTAGYAVYVSWYPNVLSLGLGAVALVLIYLGMFNPRREQLLLWGVGLLAGIVVGNAALVH